MTFDTQLALHCAKTIQALYAHDIGPNIQNTDTDTQALVERISGNNGNTAYGLFFPGTASARDAITDIKIKKARSGAGSAHRGFLRAAASIYTDVLAAIPKHSHVIIAGHSLGGAVATITADWLTQNYLVDTLFTFGGPRVGNGPWTRDFNQRLGERTFRVVNAGDPVPHVPWVLGTYRHTATLVYLKHDGGIQSNVLLAAAQEFTFHISRLTSYDSRCSQEFVRISSHYLTNYITQLERLKAA